MQKVCSLSDPRPYADLSRMWNVIGLSHGILSVKSKSSRGRMKLLIRLLTSSLLIYSGTVYSIACPPMPSAITQVDHDVKSDVNAAIGSLGKIKAGELQVKTDVVAKIFFLSIPTQIKFILYK